MSIRVVGINDFPMPQVVIMPERNLYSSWVGKRKPTVGMLVNDLLKIIVKHDLLSFWWYSIILTKNPFHDIADTNGLALIEAERSSLFVDQGNYLVRDTNALFDTAAIFWLRTGAMCSCHLFSFPNQTILQG